MPKIASALVQNGEDQDSFLHKELFPVNKRLFLSNASYRSVVIHMLDVMEKTLLTDFSDYATLKGISGANVGFPFNLVVVMDGNDLIRMINPDYKSTSHDTRKVNSNCGSLNLEESIEVKRFKKVEIEYLDEEGIVHKKTFSGALGSTIQHEIEHNYGILIIDK